MMVTCIEQLHKSVAAVAPIRGVSIGVESDKSTWCINFSPEATARQRAAAQSVVDQFDPTPSVAALLQERRERDAFPFLLPILSLSLELERAKDELTRADLAAARELLVDEYMVVLAKIRDEIK